MSVMISSQVAVGWIRKTRTTMSIFEFKLDGHYFFFKLIKKLLKTH